MSDENTSNESDVPVAPAAGEDRRPDTDGAADAPPDAAGAPVTPEGELAADAMVADALSHEPRPDEPSSDVPPESVTEPLSEGVEVTSESTPETGANAGAAETLPEETIADAEAPAAAPATGMPSAELRAVVEALIFASPEPITPKTLYKLLANESKEDVSAAVNELRLEYMNRPGLQMVEVAGGYQITTRPELHDWVRRLFHERSTQKLSVAALETLAVLAYKQPVTALEVTEIRGVNASGVLSTLLERNLVKIVGRKNVVGRPFMYGTTKEFLIRFGLKDLGDLPRIEDMADALGFDPPAGLVERTPREEMLPLDETEEGSPSVEADAAGTAEQPQEGSPTDLDATHEEAPDPEAS